MTLLASGSMSQARVNPGACAGWRGRSRYDGSRWPGVCAAGILLSMLMLLAMSSLSHPAPLPVLLIANRGEIAIRIARAAADLGWRSVGIVSQDDRAALHARHVDAVHVLPGHGVPAYLDIDNVVAAALAEGCTHVHPGYGFLSESAAFARACAVAGLVFVGPSPQALDLLGDKARARALAKACGVPVTAGLDHAVSLAEAQSFLAELGEGIHTRAIDRDDLAAAGGEAGEQLLVGLLQGFAARPIELGEGILQGRPVAVEALLVLGLQAFATQQHKAVGGAAGVELQQLQWRVGQGRKLDEQGQAEAGQ